MNSQKFYVQSLLYTGEEESIIFFHVVSNFILQAGTTTKSPTNKQAVRPYTSYSSYVGSI